MAATDIHLERPKRPEAVLVRLSTREKAALREFAIREDVSYGAAARRLINRVLSATSREDLAAPGERTADPA